jgi:cytidylate kinase
MIINIRGTSGSGKSTLARQVIDHYKCVPLFQAGPRGDNQTGYLDGQRRTFVVGRYTTPCGGCDTIGTQLEVEQRVEAAFDLALNVVFEGLLISTITDRWLRFAAKYPGHFTFAYLTTPIEVCVKRIKERRLEKGNMKPFNEVPTRQKFEAIRRTAEKFRAAGLSVIELDWEHPLVPLLEIMR